MKPRVKPLASGLHRLKRTSRDANRHPQRREAARPVPDAPLRYFTYLVFAAFASAATALFESCCEFMNFVTTSEIAPAAASG